MHLLSIWVHRATLGGLAKLLTICVGRNRAVEHIAVVRQLGSVGAWRLSDCLRSPHLRLEKIAEWRRRASHLR
jgi:hypothetical protein